jgi:hypothetical protein
VKRTIATVGVCSLALVLACAGGEGEDGEDGATAQESSGGSEGTAATGGSGSGSGSGGPDTVDTGGSNDTADDLPDCPMMTYYPDADLDGYGDAAYPGAFELAKEVGVAVLPIAIQGTFTALPATGFTLGRANMCVTVLPAVPVEEVRRLSVEALRDRVRGQVAALIGNA